MARRVATMARPTMTLVSLLSQPLVSLLCLVGLLLPLVSQLSYALSLAPLSQVKVLAQFIPYPAYEEPSVPRA
jgi:hypothetical protein